MKSQCGGKAGADAMARGAGQETPRADLVMVMLLASVTAGALVTVSAVAFSGAGSVFGATAITTGMGTAMPAVLGAAIAAIPGFALFARATAQREAAREGLRDLLEQARTLDQGIDRPAAHQQRPATATADEVSRAMRLSTMRLEQRLLKEAAFSSNAAYQLRAPLAELRTQLEHTADQAETPARIRPQLRGWLSELDRLERSIGDLLALAKFGTLPQSPHPTDVALAAVSARQRWARTAQDAGRQVELTAPLVPAYVCAPAAPISQVLDILIGTTLQRGTGDVAIRLDQVGERTRISVSDSGCEHASVNEPTASAPREPRPDDDAGLTLAQHLTEACGGQLTSAEGPIAAYEIFLPPPAPRHVPTAPIRRREQARSSGKRGHGQAA